MKPCEVSDPLARMDTFGAITWPAFDVLNLIRKRAAAMFSYQHCSNLSLTMYAVAVTVTLLHESLNTAANLT